MSFTLFVASDRIHPRLRRTMHEENSGVKAGIMVALEGDTEADALAAADTWLETNADPTIQTATLVSDVQTIDVAGKAEAARAKQAEAQEKAQLARLYAKYGAPE